MTLSFHLPSTEAPAVPFSPAQHWAAYAARLADDAVADRVLVESAIHAVLSWLRNRTQTRGDLLALYFDPTGDLVQSGLLVHSLIAEPDAVATDEVVQVITMVIFTACDRRWAELAPAAEEDR